MLSRKLSLPSTSPFCSSPNTPTPTHSAQGVVMATGEVCLEEKLC